MALNDAAVLTAAKGYIYTSPVGTKAPTPANVEAFNPDNGLTSLAADGVTSVTLNSVGHTSREDLPAFGFDGGEDEVRGTWQNPSLKTVTSETPVDYVTFVLSQLDETGLELYYGVTNGSSTVGQFDVSDVPTSSVEKALTIVITDGSVSIAFHAPKTSIKRDGEIELATDDFAGLPVKATLLKNTGSPLFSWISTDTGVNPA